MNRRTGLTWVGFNIVLLAGMTALNLLVEPPASGPTTAPLAVVGSVVGQVEVHGVGSPRWEKASVGRMLSEGDEIRSSLFSEVTLYLRDSSSVVITPNTSFVVGADQIEKLSFELGEGRITAAIPESAKKVYLFRSRGSDAVAATKEGEFSLSSDGKGTVTLDTRKGKVKLEAKGKEISVPKGKRSVVLPDKEPSKLMPIPASVALQVRWPSTKLDKTTTKLTGKTEAGAMVLVNGILVRADNQGAFSLDVPLHEGENRLVVTSTGTSGDSARRESPEIQVDTRPPEVRVDAEGLWK
ncbi:MAG: FecR domain-containing protein [Deltaproteobacteria bacterium]|nr:FecR domain-containing protein [Deltaproteobacteria bacterium]